MPPVRPDAWRTSLVPATSVPVPPSTAVEPRRVPTGPRVGVGTGSGRENCALPTAGQNNKPPKTAAAKLKPNEFLWRIVASLFSASRFMFPPLVRLSHDKIIRVLLQKLSAQVSRVAQQSMSRLK